MLIKSVRIRTASGAGPLARHLLDGDDNESVKVLQGNIADLGDAVEDARRFSRTYALRHFIIAPELPLSRDEFRQSVSALASEFGFEEAAALIVEHRKPRATPNAADVHLHVVLPEVHGTTGRVLSSAHDRPRHEKIARLLELNFGHPVVSGAHDLAVLAALRQEGQNEVADRLAGHLGHGRSRVEAFTTKAHQAAKRAGVDLAQAKVIVQQVWAASDNGSAFRERLAEHGLVVVPGEKPETWVVRSTHNDVFVGAGHRLAGVHRANFNSFIERIHDRHATVSAPDLDDRRTSDLSGHTGLAPRHGDDPIAREERGIAAGRRRSELSGERDQSAAHGDRRDRTEPEIAGGAARPAGRARHRDDLAPDERGRLIEAVQAAMKAISVLDDRGVGLTYDERLSRHLGELEMTAQADIAAAKQLPLPSLAKLEAARHAERLAGKRHDELLKRYHAFDDALIDPTPHRQSMIDRLLGRRAPEVKEVATSGIERAALWKELVWANRRAVSATATVARAEKEHSAARVTRQSEAEDVVRRAQATLAAVVQTRQLVRAHPHLVWAGPSAAFWFGQKVERWRRRSQLRDPWATDIWGIPVQPR